MAEVDDKLKPESLSDDGSSGDLRENEYRSISLWSVSAVVVGGLSAITMLVGHPVLIVIPVVGIVVAIIAMVQTGGPAAIVSGRRLAVVGLVLSTTFSVSTLTSHFVHRLWVRQEARQFADGWVEALRLNRRRAVHEMSLVPRRRCPGDQTLSHCYRNAPGRRDALDRYLDHPTTEAVKTMLRWGRSVQVEHLSTRVLPATQAGFDAVGVEYRIRFNDLETKPRYLRVQVDRMIDVSADRAQWRVVRQTLADDPL